MSIQQQGEYAVPELLADTEWLAGRLDNDNIRIVDTDVAAAYQRGHVPGAVLIPDNYQKDSGDNKAHILPPERFATMMESLGIGDDTLVVTYDNSRSLYAGRLWWALRYYGHDNVKVLNGGWRKWIKEGRPISLDSISRPPNAKFTPKVDESLFVSTDRLKQVYDEPDVVVWDVRTKEEYTGENSRHNARPGHIPGATHLEWVELMDSETHTFKPPDEMRRILESKGITPDKEVLAH